jgi:hypothetical protein
MRLVETTHETFVVYQAPTWVGLSVTIVVIVGLALLIWWLVRRGKKSN